MKYIRQVVRLKHLFTVLLFVVPSFVVAAGTLNDIEDAALNLLNSIVPLLIVAAVVFFLWSVLKYVNSGDDAETRTQSRSLMVYGVIAIFVMVSLWGLVGLLRNTFNLNDSVPVDFNTIILEMP